MNATLHLPDGRRVRTATGRRYVVVDIAAEWGEFAALAIMAGDPVPSASKVLS